MSNRRITPMFCTMIAVAALATGGCASTPNIMTHTDPDADFSQYSTFGFFQPLATDQQGYESMVSNFLKVAVTQEMDRLGLSYSDSPDLMVNFYVHTKEKIRSRSVPSASVYYGYRSRYYYDPWAGYGAYQTEIDQYTEGTLTIDVVDAKAKKLVWEGSATGRITEKAVREMERSIDGAVKAIMADFPAT